jgi:hypothetical protein
MATVTTNDNVIISRIQQRRGLKQDLPQPLRSGEFGFATDSKQLYIGGELSSTSNISVAETTTSALAHSVSISNTRIIHFTVPHKRFPIGTYDGVTTSSSWGITTETFSGSGQTVFNPNIYNSPTAFPVTNVTNSTTVTVGSSNTFISTGDVLSGDDVTGTVSVVSTSANGSNASQLDVVLSSAQTLTTSKLITFTPNNIKNILTNENFKSTDVTVLKNTVKLTGDNTSALPSADTDYSLSTSTLGSNTHTLAYRVAPLSTDEISVTYYGNSAVKQSISNTTTVFAGTSTQSFNAQESIPEYRQISNSLVRVNETTGTGLIGLEFKHLAIYEDGTTISNPTNLTLGNLLVSNNSNKSISPVALSASGSTVTISTGTSALYSNASTNDYIFVEKATTDSSNADFGPSWIHGKTLPVTNVQTNTMEVSLPTGNVWYTARPVTASAASSNVVTLTGDVAGVTNGDYVKFIGANVSQFSNATYQVTSVSSTGFTVVDGTVSNPVVAGLDYINYGSTSNGANVQIISESHGLPIGSNVELKASTSASQVSNAEKTVLNGVSESTYFIASTNPVTANVSGTADTVLSGITKIHHTPVLSLNLSGNTSITEAIATVQNSSEFPNIALIPGFTNKIYISTKASNDSVGSANGPGVEFTLHEDSTGTLNTLGLTRGAKTRTNNTVKAKLERWFNNILDSKDIDLFTSVLVNDKFSSTSINNLGTYNLDLTDTDDQQFIKFKTREEAQNFNYIVNGLYFATANPDIKGLLNLETNIQLLTSETAGGGSKITTFDSLNSATISNSGSSQLAVTIDSSSYDSFILNYTCVYDGTTDGNYRRVGQMLLNSFGNTQSNPTASEVLMQDMATDVAHILSGDVQFTSVRNGTDIEISAVNTTGKQLTMKYLISRWSS